MTAGEQPGIVAGGEPVRSWLTKARVYWLRKEWLRGYTLLSPTLIVMICALALPIFSLIVYSFWTQDYVHIDKTATLKNYQTFFDKWMYGSLLLRSIRMSATVTFINIMLAYPIAYLLSTVKTKTSNMLIILVLLPFWTSLLVRTSSWIALLQKEGVINDILVGHDQ